MRRATPARGHFAVAGEPAPEASRHVRACVPRFLLEGLERIEELEGLDLRRAKDGVHESGPEIGRLGDDDVALPTSEGDEPAGAALGPEAEASQGEDALRTRDMRKREHPPPRCNGGAAPDGLWVDTEQKNSHSVHRMDLLVSQLKTAIRRLLAAKGVRARVLDKVNRYGEIVIGVILERAAPAEEAVPLVQPEPVAPAPRPTGEDAGGGGPTHRGA